MRRISAVLPNDALDVGFQELFRDLAFASRALGAYPPGHPAVRSGLVRAVGSLDRLLESTGTLELGTARDGLLWGDRHFATPAPARLATLLRRRGAAVLRLVPGVTAPELETLLTALSLDPRRARRAGSLAAELAAAGIEHIAVTDLDFSAVVLTEEDDAPAGEAAEGIWNRLVQRLIESGALPAARLDAWLAGGGTTADLVRALLRSPGSGGEPWMARGAEEALRAAAAEYAERPDGERLALLGAVSAALEPARRERLARELGGALAARLGGERALAAFFGALPEEQRSRLEVLLEPGRGGATPAPAAPVADRLSALRRAFAAPDIDALGETDDTPSDPTLLLELAASQSAEPALVAPSPTLAEELAIATSARANASALLELAENESLFSAGRSSLLHRMELAYRELLGAGRLRPALDLVERVHRRAAREGEGVEDFKRCAERLASRESLLALTRGLPELSESGTALARELVERLGATAARHLLGVLAETEDRTLRHRLLDLLASLGPLIVRDATHLLSDPRWYVVRNVLLLLRRVGDPGSVPAVRRCAEHPDLRVRLEAIRNLFAFDQELPRELLREALGHRDPRLALEAIDLAGEHAMAEAAEPLTDLLLRWDPFGRRRAVRLRAIRALAAIGDASALERLNRHWGRFSLLPPAEEERVALYESLAAYPREARALWIARGKRARSAAIRRLAAGLEERGEEPV